LKNNGLRFEVKRYCGAPLISAKGNVDAWHMETLRRLLHSFNWKGHQDVIVDLSETVIGGPDGVQGFVELIKTWHPEMNVQLVAAGQVRQTLAASAFPFKIHLCSTLHEAAQCICRQRRTDDAWADIRIESVTVTELPKAA
jgi:hypothetical protein